MTLEWLRRRNPGAPLSQVILYEFMRNALAVGGMALWGLRVEGLDNLPKEGAALVVGNHQSHLDPPMMGCLSKRHFHFVARSTLFDRPEFGWLIRNLNAIPINQNKGDTSAIKTTLERLRQGQIVLIYPEGSRTWDGALHTFQPGVGLLIKRGRVPVVPMAIEGAYDVWPRTKSAPSLKGKIRVKYGRPIPFEELKAMDTRQMLAMLKDRVDDLRLELRRRLRHQTRGRFPAAGAGDYRHDDPRLIELRLRVGLSSGGDRAEDPEAVTPSVPV